MAPPSLLGPPEIYQQTKTSQTATAGDPFIDLMVENFNKRFVSPKPPMGLTENMSPTFLSSGNSCLDFFFHIVPDTPPESLTQRLQLAWAHNPLTTLKLVCNLRGVRGTGKSDKEGFYTAALWLYNHHPKTLSCNIAIMADFGYFKDLLEILFRILEGHDVRKQQREKRLRNSCKNQKNRKFRFRIPGRMEKKKKKKRAPSSAPRELRVAAAMERAKMEKENARESRKQRRISIAKKVVERYGRDPDFRFLYDRVSDCFADCLKSDIEFLKSNQLRKLSLAAKWCPSLDSSFDCSTLLCESIARKVFPREDYPEYEGIEEAHYAYRVRDRLRKEILVPLRKALELPEVYIGANRWDLIPYNRVASVAMKLYKVKFKKHDGERFMKYLEDVRAGKTTIAAGALLPHEIISNVSQYLDVDEDGGDEVSELQWKRIVDDMSKKGKLRDCIAISDVSGSMEGTPMAVSLALGILVSELSEAPWKGKIISFSHDPHLHFIEGDTLKSKTQFVRNMEWGMNTDFQKVFDLILEVAVKGNLRPEQMVKRVFVFSDMEFDQASTNSWETDYEAIVRKYRENGYGTAVPEVVFWNLRDSRSTPVMAEQKGVAMVSGFSKNLISMFMDNDGVIQPLLVMEAAISGGEYQKLAIMD